MRIGYYLRVAGLENFGKRVARVFKAFANNVRGKLHVFEPQLRSVADILQQRLAFFLDQLCLNVGYYAYLLQ